MSVTFGYAYDPEGRMLETETAVKGKAEPTMISHYSGSGAALTWPAEEGNKKWSRDIPGIDGALDAVQESGKTPTLQLHDLQGNIVGTAGDSESETKLLSTYNSTEFGVPSEGKTPPKYAWLGAAGMSTEISFGSGVATQGGASYVPQVARALQTAPVVPPGAFPNGSPGTQFTAAPVAAGAIAGAQEIATQFWQSAEAERQKAREEEAAAALQKCQEEGGCFDVGDPPNVQYYGQTESNLLYAGLGAGGSVVSALNSLGFLKGLSEKLINTAVSFIAGHFSIEVIENWFANIDYKLGRCVNAMSIAEGTAKERNPTCRVQTEVDNVGEFSVPFTGVNVSLFSIPDFWLEPQVSYCKYGTAYCYAK